MKTRTWPYGTQKHVTVIDPRRGVLILKTDDGEAWALVGHGITGLPKKGSRGIITFTEGGPIGGYWTFTHEDSTPVVGRD